MDIRYLKGVGEKRAAQLAKLELFTAEDLLQYYPRDYVDYSQPCTVADAPYDEKCAVRAVVYGKTNGVRVRGGKTVFKVTAGDDTGSLALTYFNAPYAVEKLVPGDEYIFYGKVGGTLSMREMTNPTALPVHSAETEPFAAVYPQTEGINSAYLSKCIRNALDKGVTLPEYLPEAMRREFRLAGKMDAVRMIHFPRSANEVHEARRRLIFEELLALQLGMLVLRVRDAAETGARIRKPDLTAFFKHLPFTPTNAQMRSIGEIVSDLQQPVPMNRLLQGDVGSGKTLVAAAAMLAAVQSGYQAVLMAPTEILASQHAKTLAGLLEPLGVTVALLTGSVKGAAKKRVVAAIASGEAQVVVGTHAVLSEGVEFANLGLAVTDEQHRFGVRQRTVLANKAHKPHLLVMSATPIPRTLGLLMFGDLDVSVLDELPPGRTPVRTYAVTGKKRRDMYGFLRSELAAGRQAYIVCPAIDDGENDLLAVNSYYTDVAVPLLEGYRVGLMHGRLKPREKAAVMDAFARHELDALVSTTVIEVGVDVPNASVIVIENAERYGLSALHQLRGRVGRGGGTAHCVLVSDHATESVRKRLSFLCHTTDGFEIAKYDLETRGPGDFFGSRQHGLPTLRIASLANDTRILKAAQEKALEATRSDPTLEQPEHAELRELAKSLFARGVAMN